MEKARHEAALELVNNKHRITALTYGTSGFLNFLDTLFTQLSSRATVHKHFNYYFALKKQLEELEEQTDGPLGKHSMLTANSANFMGKIESEDLPADALKLSATGDRMPLLKPLLSIPVKRRYSVEIMNENMVQVN